MRAVTQAQLLDLIAQAHASPRGRTNLNLHQYDEPVQRMINALTPQTYVTPHKHENPDKTELLCALIGEAVYVEFDDQGQIVAHALLQAGGPTHAVDIPPRVYHAIVPLTDCALLEIIQGPYDAQTHKQFAPWCPLEGSTDAPAYWQQLTAQLKARLVADG
jgi:cupin fold WbuC family metalloprotein